MRRVICLLVAVVLLGTWAPGAHAQPAEPSSDWARPLPDPKAPGVVVGTRPVSAGRGGGAGCVFTRDRETDWLNNVVGIKGTGYQWRCADGRTGYTWVPPQARVDPVVLARQAARRLALGVPAVGTSPPAGVPQVVNVRTLLWVDPSAWRPRQATASLPGVSATVVAEPELVIWEMGEGGRVVCRGPGVRYDPARPAAERRGGCGYTYRRSSAAEPGERFVVTARVRWRVTWTASGAPGGGVLAPVTSSARVALRVAELQALNRATW